jgi:hypothetical protein
MIIRPYRPSDEPKLRADYLKRFPGKDWRPLDGAVALVVADERDEPRMLVAAHLIAEIRMSVDPDWGTPGLREEALLKAHDAMGRELRARGIERAISLLEPEIARAFGRRLKRLRGWVASRCEPWLREV